MTTPQSVSRLAGSIRAENGRGTVRMEDVYATDAADLWTALTDPDRLSRWIAEVTGDLRLGGRFEARFTSGWEGAGRIDACEPNRRLVATMSPDTDEETVIEATLADEGGRTRLVIEERGIPLGEIAAHGAGWQVHAEDLAAHLAGGAATDWADRCSELIARYRELAAGLT